MQAVDEAIQAIARGEMIAVVDDDDRENEGDLIVAAAKASPEAMAFMIRHTSGIICAPLSQAEARRLKLDPMVARNDAPLGTAFTVSVDYRHGLTTGISAEERCHTVRALANANSSAEDFVRPGHVFPLIARDGGVLMRSGHTEAAVDLARLAGLSEAGAIGELMNDDGTVMRGPQVTAFARAHGLKLISVADLIAYRQRRERLVERTAEFEVQTEAGPARGVAYRTPFDQVQHLALVFGSLGDGQDVPVRLHRENLLGDVFGADRLLRRMVARLGQEGRGVLVYLREGATGVPAQALKPRDGQPSNSDAARERDWREIGLGAQILRDLGVSSIRLLTTRVSRYVGVAGFGIAIVGSEVIAG